MATRAQVTQLQEEITALKQAAVNFLNSYKQSADCGDWGNIDLNKDEDYMKLRELADPVSVLTE